MKLVSWNVNGLRACVTKGFMDYYKESQADIFCVQETKLQAGQIEMDLGEDVYQYWNYAIKKGYSGTAVFTRIKPLSVRYGMEEDSEPEGRMITLEFDRFYLVNVYTPNAKRDLTRLPYRLEWEDRFLKYILQLEQTKPVIVCGDLNVAHQEIDLKNPKPNMGNSGFTLEERGKMTELLAAGYVDSFRHLYPDRTDVYSWWSYMPKVRERNVGWRIDYFLVSNQLAPRVEDANIDCHVMGSDHCPVGLTLQL
ncbi:MULTISPECIES: exodeoxyribonuclease III [Paenibacillus]|uniref:Exodeoxyribonuclease III Xth n=1 Tax=Paenibacillus illinoisensis TaxID=59845 RepID=A0A2W0C8S7_9BACL|nr:MULTISPECIES: exodeoxyribonuclease III [Paenibacillus]MBE7684143.1 exodeoxyribonuclease III [Paenibacillus sp. P13VS]MBY0217069.1 exodeoxyribonuclease III [Paenibacillus illinoisensis]MCG7383029.1 exodeoxyribonuclease III [Paenibacillus sp. ACRRY]MCM3206202.1 exodeoxyribonuclease III [Paenibacillus illinoisensis]PYY26879.1 Exodeoxyribonuclease III Xth [Paenibacillus illinoisensis]